MVAITTAGLVSGFWGWRSEKDDKVFAAVNATRSELFQAFEALKADAEQKYATKQELVFLTESLSRVERGVDIVLERTYDIQKNQVLVKVANDQLVQIKRRLTVANENVNDLKEQVRDQNVMVEKVLDKKKKK